MLAKCFWLYCFQNLAQLPKNQQMNHLQLSLWQFLNQRAESKISKHYWRISLKSYPLDVDREISWWSTVSWSGTSRPVSQMMTTIRRLHSRSHHQLADPALWLSRKIAKFSLYILGSSWIHYSIQPSTPQSPRNHWPFLAQSWPVFGWCWILACKASRAYFQRLQRRDPPLRSGARRSLMRADPYSLESTRSQFPAFLWPLDASSCSRQSVSPKESNETRFQSFQEGLWIFDHIASR